MNTIPANLFVNVQPGVLSAGGNALDLNGLVLSESTRVPVGSVLSFPNAAAVASYFGPSSAEAKIAGGGTRSDGVSLGAGYFGGYTNSTKKPNALLFAQYNTSAVGAYLRGGSISSLSIAALQAINGTVILYVDGSEQTGAVDLSGAASFSAAAALIETALNTATAATGSVAANVVVGRIDPTAGTGSIAGTVLTLSATTRAGFAPGAVITGSGVAAGTTIVEQLTGTAGAAGTYTVSISQTVASTAITAASGTLVVSALTTGALFVGQTLSGSGVTSGTKISAFLTGTGGTGTYAVDTSQTVGAGTTITGTGGLLTISAVSAGTLGIGDVFTGTGVTAGNHITAFGTGTGLTGTYFVSVGDTAGSTAISVAGADVDVSYDSVSGGLLIESGTTGAASTITAATGTASAALKLTVATGAVLSQGANAAAPAAFMDGIVETTQNWATFMTAFDPDVSGHANKLAFAAWVNGQNDRYAYVCWDTDITPTESVPATGSLGYALQQNASSGTCLIYEPSDYNYAAFVCGFAASIDFARANGRTTLAFRGQAGLTPTVTDATSAVNLGGSPQSVGDYGNGYNYYAAIATAHQQFIDFQRGTISGDFQWFDSYVNQIWLNNAFQQALMVLLQNSPSIPYNQAGNALIEAALADPINAGLNFGAFRPGVALSEAQKAEVNAAAGGIDIATTLQNRGWYLQIGVAAAQVRQSRGTPPMTFWYVDGQSVQSFNMASILVQ